MKFISVRDLRGKSAQIWRQLSNEKDMVVTSNGKPIAILSTISENTLEESLSAIRQARAVVAVEAMQSESIRSGSDHIKLSEINAQIACVRRERAK